MIGPEYPFGLEDTYETDAFAAAEVKVEMRDANRVFFRGDTTDRGDELFFVQLELKDRSKTVTVSATYVELRPDGSQCERRVERRATGYRRLYFPPRCREGTYRPRSVIVTCGDGGLWLRTIRWRGWDRDVATGRAVALANTCDPSCARGRYRRYRVSIRAFRPRRCVDTGRYQYTRSRVRFIGRKWSPGPRRFTQRFPCW